MSNEFYNPEQKEEYLNTLDEQTRELHKYGFYRSFNTEDILEKDLCRFTTDEIIQAIKDSEPSTYSAARVTYSVFKKYFEWASKNGRTNSNVTSIDSISTDMLRNCIPKKARTLFSADQINEIGNKARNTQDSAAVFLLFEGAYGKGLAELINLTYSHVNWNKNHLKLLDEKSNERDLYVSDKCMALIESAYKSEVYYSEDDKERNLVRNDFILRPTKAPRSRPENPIGKHVIYTRLERLSEEFELPYFRAKTIQKSGMLYESYKLLKSGKYKDLSNELIHEVLEKFGFELDANNRSTVRDFVNEDNILDIYNFDMK